MIEFKIQIDTREQLPFSFSFYTDSIVKKKLDTGDYSLVGFQNKITIDRKHNISELYTNLFSDYVRFKKELIRMTQIEECYILCEFPYSHVINFPKDMPRGNYRFNAGQIIEKINHIEGKYNVKFLFMNSRDEAESKCYGILKEFYDRNS